MGLLCIIVLSFTMAVIFRKKWLETLPLSVFVIMLLTYSLGVVNWLDKLWLLKWGIFLGCIIILFLFIRRNSFNDIKIKEKISVGLLMFTVTSIGMALILSSHLVVEWDDLNHWGITVKQMFYIDAIPNGQNAISDYNDYPPIGSLFIHWFLSDFKEFRENLIFPIYNFGVLICLTPFFKRIPDGRNKICKQITAFFICLLLPGAFACTVAVNLKIDSFVSVLFLFIAISVLEIAWGENKLLFWDALVIFSALSVMMLTKSVGIYLAVVATVPFLIFVFCQKNKKYIAICAIGTIIEFIFYFSWKIFCNKYGNTSYISAEFGKIHKMDYLRTMKAVLVQMPWFLYPVLIYIAGMLLLALYLKKDKISEKGKCALFLVTGIIDLAISVFCRYGYLNNWFETLMDDRSREYVTKHYIYYFCKQSVNFQLEENVTYGMSALECIMLITIIMLLICCMIDGRKYKRYLIVQSVLLIGFIIYVAGHLAMYRYMFTEGEAAILSAYSRYLMMYLGGFVGGNLYLLYCLWVKEEGKYKFLISDLLLGSTVFLSNIPFMFMSIFQYHEGYFYFRWYQRDRGIAVVERIEQEMEEPENGIWIAGGDDSWWLMNEARYHFAPNKGFSDTWVLSKISEEELNDVLEKADEGIRYLAVDMSEELSEENQKKLNKILEYYHLEEKSDPIVCVYKL